MTGSLDQYENGDTTDEVLDKNGHKGDFLVFDVKLESHQKTILPSFARGRHKKLAICFLFQYFFVTPQRTISSDTNIIVFCKQF